MGKGGRMSSEKGGFKLGSVASKADAHWSCYRTGFFCSSDAGVKILSQQGGWFALGVNKDSEILTMNNINNNRLALVTVVSFLDSETTGSRSGVGTRLWVRLPAGGVPGRQRSAVRAGSGGGAGVFRGLAVPHPNSLPMSTHSAPLDLILAVPVTAIFLFLPVSVTSIDTNRAFVWMYMICILYAALENFQSQRLNSLKLV